MGYHNITKWEREHASYEDEGEREGKGEKPPSPAAEWGPELYKGTVHHIVFKAKGGDGIMHSGI